MYSAGIDIGSRTIALVVLEGCQVIRAEVVDTGFDPSKKAGEMMASLPEDTFITATGYGRHAARAGQAQKVVTEIKAHATGAANLFPGAVTVLDIGGQDMKVISLDREGNVEDFQMNDKCAAGTGKFLEVMAAALGFGSVTDFGRESMAGSLGIKINSMCTVFAESEAVSLLHRGMARRDIGRALHASVVDRSFSLIQRIGYGETVVFTGGVAMNPCIVEMLGEKIKGRVLVPESPQLVGAFGAALTGMKNATGNKKML